MSKWERQGEDEPNKARGSVRLDRRRESCMQNGTSWEGE